MGFEEQMFSTDCTMYYLLHLFHCVALACQAAVNRAEQLKVSAQIHGLEGQEGEEGGEGDGEEKDVKPKPKRGGPTKKPAASTGWYSKPKKATEPSSPKPTTELEHTPKTKSPGKEIQDAKTKTRKGKNGKETKLAAASSPKAKPSPKPKSTTSKAKAKSSPKAKSKTTKAATSPKAKSKPKKTMKQEEEPEEVTTKRGKKRQSHEATDTKPTAKEAKTTKVKATFARRNLPKTEPARTFHMSVRTAFEKIIQGKVVAPSSYEDLWFLTMLLYKCCKMLTTNKHKLFLKNGTVF